MFEKMPVPWNASHVRRLSDGAIVPIDDATPNSDYQQYKDWLAAGNPPIHDTKEPK